MGNVTVAEELAGTGELEDLYELNASENNPEDEDDDAEDEEDAGTKPEVIPHGPEPDVIPHG
jgi:Ran GTPase-activating protein (RanGAP) involved in mRNA processing and transport